MHGGRDNDIVHGSKDNDRVFGDLGDDQPATLDKTFFRGDGNDQHGGDGRDELNGESENDILSGIQVMTESVAKVTTC